MKVPLIILNMRLVMICIAPSSRNFNVKNIFQNEYPLTIKFRGKYIGATNSINSSRADENLPSDGVFKKYVSWDELSNVKPEIQEWSKIIIQENPDKLMPLHWNLRESECQSGIRDKYFPGLAFIP